MWLLSIRRRYKALVAIVTSVATSLAASIAVPKFEGTTYQTPLNLALDQGKANRAVFIWGFNQQGLK